MDFAAGHLQRGEQAGREICTSWTSAFFDCVALCCPPEGYTFAEVTPHFVAFTESGVVATVESLEDVFDTLKNTMP
jgi:hypothetical protein